MVAAAGTVRLIDRVLVAESGSWFSTTCTVSLPLGPRRAATDVTLPMMGSTAARACGPTSHKAPYCFRHADVA